ncbi:GIY-YIG nuclease family protein [Patescibacteria group bacterium]|nr:GIY-YIG nuclease family protein [Patescibacteria group bacterium]
MVYILQLSNNKLYTGYTNNLQRRIKEHKGQGVCKMIYYEAHLSEELARDRERKLKYYGSAWRALKKRISA